MDMDAAWCWQIGTLPPGGYQYYGIYGYDLACSPSDGVVPASSQDYPGRTARYDAPGVIHGEEQTSSRVYDQLYAATRDALQVLVRPPGSVARVAVSPTSAAVQTGSTLTLAAITYDVNNMALSGRTVTWSSSNAGVAAVSTTGVVSGVSAGTAIVTAASEGYTGTATITVSNPPALTGVSITGPSTVDASGATWTATASGGATPITYVWKVGGVERQRGTSRYFTWSSSTSFTVAVTAIDRMGASKTTSKSVTVQQCGGSVPC